MEAKFADLLQCRVPPDGKEREVICLPPTRWIGGGRHSRRGWTVEKSASFIVTRVRGSQVYVYTETDVRLEHRLHIYVKAVANQLIFSD